MLEGQLWAALISTVGGIIITYFTLHYKYRKVVPKKDRTEMIFDGYESLIAQLQGENKRQSVLIDQMEDRITEMQDIIAKLRQDLNSSQHNATTLMGQLDTLKTSYRDAKVPNN